MAARALARASRRLAALPQVAVETHAASSLAALSTSGVGAHTVTSALQPIFAPPSRGIASSPITTGLPSDKIHMRGLVFYAYHGVYPEEEKLGAAGTALHCSPSPAPPRLRPPALRSGEHMPSVLLPFLSSITTLASSPQGNVSSLTSRWAST